MKKYISNQDMKRLEYSTSLNIAHVHCAVAVEKLAELERVETELENLFVDLSENLISDEKYIDLSMSMTDFQAGAITLKELNSKF